MTVRIFISHVDGDDELAATLGTFLSAALGDVQLAQSAQLTVHGVGRLPALKQELAVASVVVGLLTHTARDSGELAFELGAAFALGARLILIHEPPIGQDEAPLPSWLASFQGEQFPLEADRCLDLASAIGKDAGVKPDLSQPTRATLSPVFPTWEGLDRQSGERPVEPALQSAPAPSAPPTPEDTQPLWPLNDTQPEVAGRSGSAAPAPVAADATPREVLPSEGRGSGPSADQVTSQEITERGLPGLQAPPTGLGQSQQITRPEMPIPRFAASGELGVGVGEPSGHNGAGSRELSPSVPPGTLALSCQLSLAAGRALSDCVFHREQGGPFADELDGSFGALVNALGGSWSALRQLEDLDLWAQTAENFFDSLPAEQEHVKPWYEIGFQLAILLNLLSDGAELDADGSADADRWNKAWDVFSDAATRGGLGAAELVELEGLVDNLQSADRDYTLVSRLQERVRELAQAGDV